MEKSSWACTLAIQFCLCLALFMAFNTGHPQKKNTHVNGGNGKPFDFYFITVTGGFRPLKHQTHLLKQVAKVAKSYKAMFVVNISKLGGNDPLLRNRIRHFKSLKVPWYTTRISNEEGDGYFLKQVKLAYGKTLDIVGLNTGLSEVLSNGTGNKKIRWLTRTLEASQSYWRIVVGFHPVNFCEENKQKTEEKHVYDSLHYTFSKLGVNLYISSHGCTNYAYQDGVAYIGPPGSINEGSNVSSVNETSVLNKNISNGHLLHRVRSREIVTYFVNSNGEVVRKIVLQRKDKDVMYNSQ